MKDEEIIIINDEPFYKILNGTSYDYAPIPKEFKPYFERIQQKNTQLKGVIETYEILIKANNINNWNELKKWLENQMKELNPRELEIGQFNIQNDDYTMGQYNVYRNILKRMQELEGESE